jgi:hypothetical protein
MGSYFDPRYLKCRLNDRLDLALRFFNTTYIECNWLIYENQRRYVVSVSANGGEHWVYAYENKVTFMTFPRVLKIHPATIPINAESMVQIEVQYSSLYSIKYL